MKRIFGWFWRHKRLSSILIIIVAAAVFFATRGNGNGQLEEAVVSRGDVADEMILAGVVVADEHAQLAFPVSGKISWIDVSEGEEVVKGQAMAKLDTVVLNASYQRALADYRAAQANAEEVLDDIKGNDSDETFEEKNTRTAAEAARDKAYDALVIAEHNLRESTLTSPFDGIVSYVANPFAGLNVTAGVVQIEVVNPKTIYFEVAADQSEVVDISAGNKVKIIFDANDEEVIGTVSHVSYTVIPGEIGSVYGVKVVFDGGLDSGFSYRIGMTGDAHFVLSEKKNVVYVPADFVKSDSKGDYVLTKEGKVKAYLLLGLEGEDRTEVLDGIEEGALIYD